MIATIVGNLHYDGNIHDFDSWCYRLEVDDKKFEYIRELAKKAAELEVYEITVFDAAIEVYGAYIDDGDRFQDVVESLDVLEEERTECIILHVSKDSFRYTGVLKHDCYTFCTGSIYFTEFQEEDNSIICGAN